VMRAWILVSAALHGVRQEKIRYGNGHGVVEIDVNDAGEAAENYANVAPIDEVTGQFALAEVALLPSSKYGSLAM
jgi:hypothetical protein